MSFVMRNHICSGLNGLNLDFSTTGYHQRKLVSSLIEYKTQQNKKLYSKSGIKSKNI